MVHKNLHKGEGCCANCYAVVGEIVICFFLALFKKHRALSRVHVNACAYDTYLSLIAHGTWGKYFYFYLFTYFKIL